MPRQQEYYEFYDTGRFQQYRLVFYDQEGNVTSDRPSTLTAPWTLGSCDDVALLTLNGFIYFDIPPNLPNSLIGFYSRGNDVMDMIRLN